MTLIASSTGTRQYNVTTGLRVAVGSAGARALLPARGASREVYVHANIRTFFRTGSGTIDATIAAGHHVVEAGEKFHFVVPEGHTDIAYIGDGGTGFMTIVPVA